MPSFAEAIEPLTPSPPAFIDPLSALNPATETGSGSKPFITESSMAVPMKTMSYLLIYFLYTKKNAAPIMMYTVTS